MSDLEAVCKAVGAMGFDTILELAGEEGSEGEAGWVPAWGKLFDVNLCPAKYLPYLAQYVGVEIPAGASEAEARKLVKDEPATRRGSQEAIETQIYKFSTLEKTSQSLVERGLLIERRNAEGVEDAYQFGIAVEASLIPSMVALETGVASVKPGGVLVWYQTGAKYTWSEAIHTWAEDTFAWNEAKIKRP